jgi:tripartite ATP-independent transporter DctM subunit
VTFGVSRGPGKFFTKTENAALFLSLGALIVLPLVQMALRKVLHTGISGASSFVQNLTLVGGMLGAAIAARENRLLSLSTAGTFLKGRLQTAASVFSGATAATVSVLLCIAGVQFVTAERQTGASIGYGIPVWLAQTLLPLGFGIMTLRLLKHSSGSWSGRTAAAILCAVMVSIGIFPPAAPEQIVIPAFVVLLAATILGIPIFATMGGAVLILFWGRGDPIAGASIDHYSLITNPSMATVPLFTLAGYFLAEGGAPKRLVGVFRALFGSFSGGSAIVTVIVCAFFTSFTGASGVTIIAIGGLLMPVLLAEKYSGRAALGMVTGAGSLGLLLPPCLPLILYAIVARVPIRDVFLGGVLPGIVMMVAISWWGIRQGRRDVQREPFQWDRARRAIWEAKWELMLPAVSLAALFGGIATPVEAAAVTAMYAFLAETVFNRDLSFRRDVPRVAVEGGLVIGGVLLILGVALGISDYVDKVDLTTAAVLWTTHSIHSPWVFLLVLNLFLLVVGCLMDIYSAIVIQVPLLVPIGMAFGIDPIHLGIIILANLELGYLTPPVGLNLFMSSYRFGKPVSEVLRSVMPIVIVMFVTVLLITFVPWLTTALPHRLGTAN